jgi:hypothetical protein
MWRLAGNVAAFGSSQRIRMSVLNRGFRDCMT